MKETCPPATGKAAHVLARVRASAHRSSRDQVVGLRPGRAAALVGRGTVPGGVAAPWQAAPSASMRSAVIHPGLTPGLRPARVWRPWSAGVTAVAQTPEVARPVAGTGWDVAGACLAAAAFAVLCVLVLRAARY